jgi:hypothetical protein
MPFDTEREAGRAAMPEEPVRRVHDTHGEHRGERCIVRATVIASDSVIQRDAVVLTIRPLVHGPHVDVTMPFADALAVRDMLTDVLARAVQS